MSPHPRPPSRRRVLLAGAGAAAALLGAAPAAGAAGRRGAADSLQPYASYWFPDSLPPGTPGDGITWRSLADWTPEGDRDLAFNAASVPLAQRFTPVPANTTARAGQARIGALAAFAPTAGNPSQGSATADFYAPTHWAYLDELVFWGGSSGEGLILAPNAPVTDAAHRNGVPVLGTVALHRTLPDGGRRFLGGTCGTAFYVPDLRREGNEQAVRLAVCAISELFTASDPAETTHPW